MIRFVRAVIMNRLPINPLPERSALVISERIEEGFPECGVRV